MFVYIFNVGLDYTPLSLYNNDNVLQICFTNCIIPVYLLNDFYYTYK